MAKDIETEEERRDAEASPSDVADPSSPTPQTQEPPVGLAALVLVAAGLLAILAYLCATGPIPLLLLSLPIRVAAFALALVMYARWRDWRILPLALMFLLMSARQLLFLLVQTGVVERSTATATLLNIPGLLITVLAIVSVVYLWRVFALQGRAKQAEEALRASEVNYQTVFDVANDAIFILDIETTRVLDVNRKMCEMYGYTREEACGEPVSRFAVDEAPYTHEYCAEKAREALESDSDETFEWIAQDKAGRRFWVEIRQKLAVIGGRDRLVAVVRDITRRKRAEQERLRLEAEVQRAGRIESLNVMAGSIAHNFNNILTIIQGSTDLLLMQLPPDHEATPQVEKIARAARRATELSAQMLTYVGQGKETIEPFDLSALIREMGDSLDAAVPDHVVKAVDLAQEDAVIQGDPDQVRRLVLLLVDNAAEAIGECEGKIFITTRIENFDAEYLRHTYLREELPPGPYVVIEVADTGCGMRKDTMEKAFDPFFTTHFTGRGLGLAAVLGIVRGHHGAIDVYSEPDKGTAIKVLLPLAEEGEESGAEKADDQTRSLEGATVLLADDDEIVRAMAEQMLREAGLTVLTAASSAEAVDLFRLRAQAVDCVLLDMTMPGGGCRETFDAIREIRPDARVVVVSGFGKGMIADRMAGRDIAGAFQKPYAAATILAELRRAIG